MDGEMHRIMDLHTTMMIIMKRMGVVIWICNQNWNLHWHTHLNCPDETSYKINTTFQTVTKSCASHVHHYIAFQFAEVRQLVSMA